MPARDTRLTIRQRFMLQSQKPKTRMAPIVTEIPECIRHHDYLSFEIWGREGHARGVTSREATDLLKKFRDGKVDLATVLHAFQAPPVADLGFAQVDLHRALRKNFPEVIYGEGKTPDQVARIAGQIARREQRFLVTRIGPEHARVVRKAVKPITYCATSRTLRYEKKPLPKRPGAVAV